MEKYSFYSLVKHALSYHENWQRAWRNAEPKSRYDVVIIGGGGHGLATAYYLAKVHGITDVAVVERAYLGGGNTGRNTTIIRSNYLHPQAARLYDFGLQLWADLSQELNFNLLFSQQGVITLGHSGQDMRNIQRRVSANRLYGIDAEILTVAEVQQRVPLLNCSPNSRYPVLGAALQPRGGTARHDAVAWAYARAADALGVDLLQRTEVTGIRLESGAAIGVDTSRGYIGTRKLACVAAGNSGVLAGMAGLRLPIESRPLQALVSEPLQPCLDTVIMSSAVHGYISQSDKGDLVVGAGVDRYSGYGQRGSFDVVERALQAVCQLFPAFSRVRMNRQWAGTVDISPDACPIISKTSVRNLYINCGWGTGGFKATPASGYVFADTVANDRPHTLAAPFGLNRFYSGALIDEHGAAGVAH